MNLLNTLLIYLTMVFVSSVQMAPVPSPVPVTPSPSPTAIVSIAPSVSATLAATLTPTPTTVPTPAITPNSTYRTVRMGDSGDNVTLLQRRLAELGYYTGDIDGVFGNQTRRAVERFQYYQGLSVDGIAGKRTLTVLYESEDVVFAPVDVTPSPTPTSKPTTSPAPTDTPIAALTTAPASTSAPTIAPTPSPTPTTTVSTAPTAAPEATASEAPAITTAETATAEPTATAEATATEAPTVTAAETATETATAEPAAALQPNTAQTFVLAGETQPMTLIGDASTADTQAEALHPLPVGDTVYVPLLEILKNAQIEIVANSAAELQTVSFTLAGKVYQLSYRLDGENNLIDVTVTLDQTPQTLTLNTGYVLDGVVYLPILTAQEAIGINITLNDVGDSYTVALPAAEQTDPTATDSVPVFTLTTEQIFVLTGTETALLLPGTETAAQPVTLHPALFGDTVFVPLLAILQNTGSVVLPSANGQEYEVAFSLGNDLYQLSYTLSDDQSVTGVSLLRNQEPLLMQDRTGWVADGVLYLPLQSATDATGITFTLEPEANRYAVTVPTQLDSTTE